MSQQIAGSASESGNATGNDKQATTANRCLDLALYAQVPNARHEQLVQLLAGIAGHPPNRIRELHSIFKPNNLPSSQSAADQGGGAQTFQDPAKLAARRRAHESFRDGQSWLMKAVETISDDGSPPASGQRFDAESTMSWRWSGLPDPNMKVVTSRAIQWSQLEAQDPVAYATRKDYRLLSQFALQGEQFVHNNIVILMHRLFKWPSDGAKLNTFSFPSEALIDRGSNYVLEARLTLEDTGKNELVSRAIKELTQLRELLQGCVDLRPVDRLAVDTRARG